MRFVEPKTAEQQARAVVFRIRQKLVAQRIELINALRSHLYEFGYIAPVGPQHLPRLVEVIDDENSDLPNATRVACRTLLEQIGSLSDRTDALNDQVAELGKQGQSARLLQTMPGVGPVIALAIEAFASPMESFRRGRDFAALLDLVPRQNSSGGKARLGRMPKAGQHDIRRLLIVGAIAAMVGACRRGVPEDTWLGKMILSRKPRILVAVALANKMARRIWAMLMKKESYRDPALAVA